MTSSLGKPELPPIGFLAEVSDDDRRLMGSYGEFLSARQGEEIIKEGQTQDSLYLVLGGLLHVTREAGGPRTLLARIEPGETIGEISLFEPGTATANVVAREFSQIWKIGRDDLNAFVTAYPAAGFSLVAEIARILSKRLIAMNEKLSRVQSASGSIAGA